MGILFADAGGTKIEWGWLDQNSTSEFKTSGYNPNVSDANYLRQVLITGFPSEINVNSIEKIEYYGAGCGREFGISRVKKALSTFFINAKEILIGTDLDLAGKALFGEKSGIACILGTGANAGFYSNGIIAEKESSIGYLLGDEGSGMYLGKEFLKCLFRNKLDVELTENFYHEYKFSKDQLIDQLYKSNKPNVFLAQFVPFLKKHITNEQINGIVVNAIKLFNVNYINSLQVNNENIGFVGGVANAFKSIIKAEFSQRNIVFIENPIKSIIKLS
ncbi:MAG: hypothetical protein JEZ09_16900 [Salinivirgaceae bacterium]|nr:hypothetical protein [Salinivirgaceae bacterium]